MTEAQASTMAAGGGPKRRKVERRERLRKTALCKHFDKPGGCPFPDCKFAHGRCVRAMIIAVSRIWRRTDRPI